MFAPVGHRQVPDEVGQPCEGGGFQLGVLVQVVVEVPGLVADPEVIRLGGCDVVEHHEVRQQDLVHPPQRLEAVQIMPGGLGLEVGRLTGELGAGRVDPLATMPEHGRDRLLRQPVDLEVRVQGAQLVGDRQVSPDVAKSDRRGHVQRSPAARMGSGPPAG